MSSILVVKSSAIGDVIQAFPVLEYLRKKFPDARIDWVVEEGIAPLLRAHPDVDNVIEIRTKSWRKAPLSKKSRSELKAFVGQLRATSYDLLFDLQGNSKSALVTALAKAKHKVGFDWKSVREVSNLLATTKRFNVPTDINVRLKYLRLVQDYFEDFEEFKAEGVRLKISEEEAARCAHICSSERPQLMVCFGSKWPNKRLELATLTALLQRIVEESDLSFLFIFGDEEEKRCAEELAARFGERGKTAGHLSLPLWQALMWEVQGVIAVDSAALHLCGTTQTPSFSVFGPTSATFYKPVEDRHAAVQGACPYGKVFSSQCPILRTCATGACIRQLNVDELYGAFKKWEEEIHRRAPGISV
jgi:heptosyltransferase-1